MELEKDRNDVNTAHVRHSQKINKTKQTYGSISVCEIESFLNSNLWTIIFKKYFKIIFCVN